MQSKLDVILLDVNGLEYFYLSQDGSAALALDAVPCPQSRAALPFLMSPVLLHICVL